MRFTVHKPFQEASQTTEIIPLVKRRVTLSHPDGLDHPDVLDIAKQKLTAFLEEHNGHCFGWATDQHGPIEGRALILIPPKIAQGIEQTRIPMPGEAIDRDEAVIFEQWNPQTLDFIQWERVFPGLDIPSIDNPEHPVDQVILKTIFGKDEKYALSSDNLSFTYTPTNTFPEDKKHVSLAKSRRQDALIEPERNAYNFTD